LRSPPVGDAHGGAYGQQGDAKGSKMFVDYSCYACHGFSGQNGPQATGPDEDGGSGLHAYVRSPGTNQMPLPAKVLTDQQLADIWAYIARCRIHRKPKIFHWSSSSRRSGK
jgi:mono/diheme cytochrome c family protein